MPMRKKNITDYWQLTKAFRGYLVWGLIVLIPLSVGLYQKSSDIILVVTALIIFFYTFETHKMRQAIVENTELNTRPILVLEINFKKKIAYIKNFGNFPAYNFQIENYHFELGQDSSENDLQGETTIFYKDFPILDVIPPKDRMLILDGTTTGNDHVFFTILNPSIALTKAEEFTFKATALYDDISSNSWKMTIGYGGGNIIATKPQKVERRKKAKKQKEGEPD